MSEHICPDVQSALTDVGKKMFIAHDVNMRSEARIVGCRLVDVIPRERELARRVQTPRTRIRRPFRQRQDATKVVVHHNGTSGPIRTNAVVGPSAGPGSSLFVPCHKSWNRRPGQPGSGSPIQPQLIQHTCSDSATCQLWQMVSSPLTWANHISTIGVLSNLLRLDRFEGTACLFHV